MLYFSGPCTVVLFKPCNTYCMSVVRTGLNVSWSLLHVYPCIHIYVYCHRWRVRTVTRRYQPRIHNQCFFFSLKRTVKCLMLTSVLHHFYVQCMCSVFLYSLTNVCSQCVYFLSWPPEQETQEHTPCQPLLLPPSLSLCPCAFTASQCPCISSSGWKPGPWTAQGPASSGSEPGAWNPASGWRRSCRSDAGRSGPGRPTETPWSPRFRETEDGKCGEGGGWMC